MAQILDHTRHAYSIVEYIHPDVGFMPASNMLGELGFLLLLKNAAFNAIE